MLHRSSSSSLTTLHRNQHDLQTAYIIHDQQPTPVHQHHPHPSSPALSSPSTMAAPPTSEFRDLKVNLTQSAAASSITPTSAQSRGPSPNRGASVPDNEAIGSDSISQAQWFADEKIDKSQWVRLRKLSHMRYQHKDLDVITGFLRGMYRCRGVCEV